jgi:transposase-like protein
VNLHANATTILKQRECIQESDKPVKDLAEEMGVSETTVRRWNKRDHVPDRSSQPHELQTTLSPAEQATVVELCKILLLSVVDLSCVVREFINPDCSRSNLIRLLRRFDVTPLRNLLPEDGTNDEPPKSFKE